MTSLYGTFQYFDDSFLDCQLRRLYFQQHPELQNTSIEKELTCQSPISIAPRSPTNAIEWLQTYHPLFCHILQRAQLWSMWITDPTPRTLFLIPEKLLQEQWEKGDLSVWACRQLSERYWIPELLPPCFFLDQSPSFDIYNKRYVPISCQQTFNGKMMIDSQFLLDVCSSSPHAEFWQDSSQVFYSLQTIPPTPQSQPRFLKK